MNGLNRVKTKRSVKTLSTWDLVAIEHGIRLMIQHSNIEAMSGQHLLDTLIAADKIQVVTIKESK